MSIAEDGEPFLTDRIYREPASALQIPLNLQEP